MSTPSLKLELINWLTNLNDKKVLESIASVKDSISSNDWYDELSSSQKKSLQKGIEEHKKGKFVSSKQFWARYAKKNVRFIGRLNQF